MPRKLLLVGWDSADWLIIQPLIEAGKMPNIARLIEGGVMGNLSTLQPCISPMLWNSIATGKRPDKHGILGFVAPSAEGGVVPVLSTSRKVKAVWNILTQQKLRTHVVGWFAGHPAEPINGVCVSPLFHSVKHQDPDDPWPVPSGTIHPAELTPELASLRIHPGEFNHNEILPFVPLAERVDQDKDLRLSQLGKNLAELLTNHNAATWILQNREWDFVAVYHTWLDHMSHVFMHFHPPRMPHVSEEQFEIYKDVVKSAYIYQDMLLGVLVELAGPEATVMVVSDHGYQSGHLRPPGVPDEGAGPIVWHRDQGIFVLAGPGVRKDELIHGATLLDVTPTILTLFDLPAGADMDGRVLAQAFETPPEIRTTPSWEEVPGNAGLHPGDARIDPLESYSVLQQFVALGYVEPPGEDKAAAAKKAATEMQYNLARVYLYSARPALGIPILEQLAADDPQRRYLLNLSAAYVAVGRLQEGADMLARVKRDEVDAEWDYLQACILTRSGNDEGAAAYLINALNQGASNPELLVLMGRAFLRVGKLEDAEQSAQLARQADPDNPTALTLLARIRLIQKKYEAAAETALAAVGKQHFTPLAHLYLGYALVRLGDTKRARLALETAASLAPKLRAAHRLLAWLHMQPGGDPSRALHHQRMLHR